MQHDMDDLIHMMINRFHRLKALQIIQKSVHGLDSDTSNTSICCIVWMLLPCSALSVQDVLFKPLHSLLLQGFLDLCVFENIHGGHGDRNVLAFQ